MNPFSIWVLGIWRLRGRLVHWFVAFRVYLSGGPILVLGRGMGWDGMGGDDDYDSPFCVSLAGIEREGRVCITISGCI